MVDTPTLVIDNGSGTCKAGLAEEVSPQIILPTLVGKPRFGGIMNSTEQKDYFIGNDAIMMKGIINFSQPIKHGIIQNWEYMEKIWYHIFYNVLNVIPQEHCVLLTESAFNTTRDREKMAQVMFETFNVDGMYLASQPVLSLLASNKKRGLVVESGYGTTQIVPVYQGSALHQAAQKYDDLSGYKLTLRFQKLLNDLGIYCTTTSEIEIVRDIKEKICYVAKDFSQELNSCPPSSYELPDTSFITFGNERITCPEALFNTSLFGSGDGGVQDCVISTINRCQEEEVKNEMYGNIVLGGGNTMFPGMAERLAKEVSNQGPMGKNVKVEANENRRYSAWIGGSIFASLSSFKDLYFRKYDYEEYGPSGVNVSINLNIK
jgi:actin